MAIKSSYGAASAEICELFCDYLEGDGGRPALAIGMRPPAPIARNALEKSLEAFGYEPYTCSFASLTPIADQAEGGDVALDAQALFLLVEGLDPLHVIALDATATARLSQAYRTDYPADAPIRVFGRPSAAFQDLEHLLQTQEGKQRAWKVLKSLRS